MIVKDRDIDWELQEVGSPCSCLDKCPPCIYSINAFGKEKITAYSKPPEWFNDESKVKFWDIDPATITVVYEALPEENQIAPEIKMTVNSRLFNGSDKPYFLMVGTLEPRKNVIRQIEAWRPFKHEYNLIIAGKSGWETVEPEPGLIHIGYASSRELANLYRGASLLLYASLAEGFGLPILEAFFHRIPVVTSNGSGLAEIAADAAIQTDPLDVESIRDGIRQALADPAQFIDRGVKRLGEFSWEKAARETLEVYKKAAG
jgi:glycosyltransferase involved in cell wall biosynthesis